MLARRYIVTGQVQGVGYRFFALREAATLDVKGFVRNLPDGSVEVVAEGPADVLRDLERRLRQGPMAAIVDSVEAMEIASLGARGFTIR